MKRRLIVIMFVVLLPVLIWGTSYLYCEHLTRQYADIILSDIKETLVDSGWELVLFKVLEYNSGKSARVYAVDENIRNGLQEGWVHVLACENGQWCIVENGVSGWSQFGSADDAVWPYRLLAG